MISAETIQQARLRTAGALIETPCTAFESLSGRCGCSLVFKLESLQHTGSFKTRGALNRLLQLSDEERQRGVLAFSAGNHAQGVAWAAREVGVSARIVMPRPTPLVKVSRTNELGAQVERFGETFAEAEGRAREIEISDKRVFIHPFDDPEIVSGQGTAGLEILEQVPDVDVIVCPIGGGGLIGGIATAVKASNPGVRILGVQTATAPAMRESLLSGQVSPVATGPTLAEGIAVKTPAELTLEIVRRYVDDIALVTEREVEEAVYELLSNGRLVAEGAAAATFAALMHGKFQGLSGKKVVLLLSGGNVDLSVLNRVIERAQVREGRLARLAISVGDRPGALAGVLRIVGEKEANVIAVQHERSFSHQDLWQVEIELELETRNREHLEEVVRALEEDGYYLVTELGERPLPLADGVQGARGL